MSQVLVRDNVGLYDVLVKDATAEEATALREAFSTVDVNRDYAQQVQGSLLDAFRSNSVMQELHQGYKDDIRDKASDVGTEVFEELDEVDEFDGFSA